MTPERTSALLTFLQAAPYNIRFIDDDKLPLYDKALTTAGYAKQHDTKSNERLAFLGDRVLNLVVAEYIYKVHPGENVGDMAKVMKVVGDKSLTGIIEGKKIPLVEHVLVGDGEEVGDAVVAGAFRALMGAVYVDQDIYKVKEIVLEIIKSDIDGV